MFLSWNANLFLHLVSLTLFVTGQQRRMLEIISKCILLIIIQGKFLFKKHTVSNLNCLLGVWLGLVAVVWRYWRTLVVIRDVPEYIQFVLKRKENYIRTNIIAEDF